MSCALAVIRRIVRRDDGQDLLEYGLLAALIALIAFGAVQVLGQTILSVFWNNIASSSF